MMTISNVDTNQHRVKMTEEASANGQKLSRKVGWEMGLPRELGQWNLLEFYPVGIILMANLSGVGIQIHLTPFVSGVKKYNP